MKKKNFEQHTGLKVEKPTLAEHKRAAGPQCMRSRKPDKLRQFIAEF